VGRVFPEVLILFVCFVDVVAEGLREIGNAAFELVQGALEFG
jgi:hypothetical protein